MNLLKKIFFPFVFFFAALLSYLIVIIFFPVLSIPKQPIGKKKRAEKEGKKPPAARQDVQFSVDGIKISAWLYLPNDRARKAPCVVMNHGFGGTKDALLEKYALRFIESGFAVLTYDYRYFGASGGEPRQLYDVSYQLDDLRAAVKYSRKREEIDPERIVIWGTSAAAGYGLVIAAEDKRIKGVIAQCPGIDHEADSKLFMEREGWGYLLRLLVHAQRDKGRSRFNLSPHKVPIVGQPDSVAILTAPGAYDGYAAILGDSPTFENEVCARVFFMGHGRDPNEAAADVHCPVLFLVCEQDNLASPQSHAKAAGKLGDKAIVKSYPIGHFDIYEGVYFQEAVKEMLNLIEAVC